MMLRVRSRFSTMRSSERDAALIRDNVGLVRRAVGRYSGALAKDSALSAEDLAQAAFLGVLAAAETFDGRKGAWCDWAGWYISREIDRALGRRNGRFTKPHFGAVSLDAPVGIGDGGEDITLMDQLEDDALPPVDAGLVDQDAVREVREAVERLPNERRRDAVRRWLLDGEPQRAIAADMGVSVAAVAEQIARARAQLRHDIRLCAWREVQDIQLYRVGVARFMTTRTSAVELAVIRREEKAERFEKMAKHATGAPNCVARKGNNRGIFSGRI